LREVVGSNTDYGVTWLHSYVTPDKTKSYCIYDASSSEAVRHSATANNLPIDRITEVRVLDPTSTTSVGERAPDHVGPFW
jgi:hypothetical protein